MHNKGLTAIYIGLQSLIVLIALFFLSSNFYTENLQMHLLLSSFLLMSNCVLGMFSAISNLRKPNNLMMKIMTYAPFLLFLIGGIVLTIGVVLMLLASYMRYTFIKEEQ